MSIRIQTWMIAATMLAQTVGCAAPPTEKTETFDEFASRAAALTDRDAIRDEMVQAVASVSGTELDATALAKLDVLEARVDELDGLLYRLDAEDGATLKFYEPSLGDVRVVFIGSAALAEHYPIGGMTAAEIYRLAEPNAEIPAVLAEASARQHELRLRALHAGPPPAVPDAVDASAEAASAGSVTQQHINSSVNHGTLSNSQWESHCFNYGTFCSPGRRGSSNVTSGGSPQWGYHYRFMLSQNDPNGHPLGQMLFATFKSSGLGAAEDCRRYGQWCDFGDDLFYSSNTSLGPMFTTRGNLIQVTLASNTWKNSCPWGIACEILTRAKLANHRAEFIAGPNAIWHLARKPLESDLFPSSSVTGNVFLF